MSVDNGFWVFPEKISLRDYFAAKVMSELMVGMPPEGFMKAAQRAYEMADAMLEARK